MVTATTAINSSCHSLPLHDALPISPAGAVVIDATGKHVTAGLIDPHTHSGVSAVNESGFAIVPEVVMGDVVTHNNIWFYRQLRSEEHTSELQSLMRTSYAVFCLKKQNIHYSNVICFNN